MPRLARLVVPDYPHHVTQRGARRQQTFFSSEDYRTYLSLLAEATLKSGVQVWAYCLMPNHVHLVVVPTTEDGLKNSFREVHRKYALKINRRSEWRGHLWQERYHSCVMDESHLLAAVRYIELNPVRAGICPEPEEWPWSSIHAHLGRKEDPVVTCEPMLDRIADW